MSGTIRSSSRLISSFSTSLRFFNRCICNWSNGASLEIRAMTSSKSRCSLCSAFRRRRSSSFSDVFSVVTLIPNLASTDPLHGGVLAHPVRRAAQCDAGPSGKPRNAAGGSSRPTAGRHSLSAGVVAGSLRYQHRGATRAYPADKLLAVKWVFINETWYKPQP